MPVSMARNSSPMVPTKASGNHLRVKAGRDQESGRSSVVYSRVEESPLGQPMVPRAMASSPSMR